MPLVSDIYTRYQWNKENLTLATQAVSGSWCDSDDIQSDLVTNNLVTNDFFANDFVATNISTDSRKIDQGDLFLALSGDNFDGHDYLQVAVDRGAVAVIVEKADISLSVPQLVVTNSRLALGQLGAYRRQQLVDLKVIAITGSNGKTTVKEMLGAVFNNMSSQEFAPALITRGNLNNDLGVPMMLLELCDEHKVAILELGANHVGEIAYISQLVQPDVACILNIGTAHLGEFGGRDNIAVAKSEIYQSLQQGKTAIVPADDDYSELLSSVAYRNTEQVVVVGQQKNSHIHVSDVILYPLSSTFKVHINKKIPNVLLKKDLAISESDNQQFYTVKLPLAGKHNIHNALTVIAAALSLKVDMKDIVAGLAQVKPPKGRFYSQKIGNYTLIDDAYNANPDSIRASVTVLSALEGKTIAVLGDVGELGDSAQSEHYQLGVDLASMNIDYILTVGEFSQDIASGVATKIKQKNQTITMVQAFDDKDSLLIFLQNYINKNLAVTTNILFKGSRFMCMETLCEAVLISLTKQGQQ